MKTESTEALRYIHTCIEPNVDTAMSTITRYDAGIATEIAFKEGQSNPKIKQLEWKDNFKETRWYCDLPIGFYIIDTVRKYAPYRVRFYLSEYDLPKYERYCKTIEEAMMYAQSDFENRVKECLTTE